MEDILDVYQAQYSPQNPLVCMDESNKQLLAEKRDPWSVAPGQVARYDSEYKRNGPGNLFLAFAPLTGWRTVTVTERRTKQDWAQFMKELVDLHFPQAEKITVVLDNLNTHTWAALYETFPAPEAHRIARKLALHYTPKHGSWRNMAEIEFSLLRRQCLKRRIADRPTLQREVTAWMSMRNASHASIQWRFTTADARTKLKQLYPYI
jgi:hypothetical protein